MIGREHGFAVSRVEIVVGARDHVVRRQRVDQLAADLPARAGHENLHVPAFSGSHHQRFAPYHSTVSVERFVERALALPTRGP